MFQTAEPRVRVFLTCISENTMQVELIQRHYAVT